MPFFKVKMYPIYVGLTNVQILQYQNRNTHKVPFSLKEREGGEGLNPCYGYARSSEVVVVAPSRSNVYSELGKMAVSDNKKNIQYSFLQKCTFLFLSVVTAFNQI